MLFCGLILIANIDPIHTDKDLQKHKRKDLLFCSFWFFLIEFIKNDNNDYHFQMHLDFKKS